MACPSTERLVVRGGLSTKEKEARKFHEADETCSRRYACAVLVGESMTAVEPPSNSVPRFSRNFRAAASSRLENDWQQGINENTGATRRHKAA